MTDKYKLPEYTVSRIRYYDGLFLADTDFIDDQNYHVGAQRRHEGLLHTSGITEGLDVTITNDGDSVDVAAGSCIDEDGRQVLLSKARTVYLDALWADGARYLEISFNEAETGVADQNSTVSAATRFTHDPTIAFTESRTEGSVLLATVALVSAKAASLDLTSRVYSGVRLPVPTGSSAIELTASNDGTTAELSSKLRVDGAAALDSTLKVAGATSLNNTLAVAGASALASTLGVTGATSLANTLAVTGATALSSTLAVTGASTLSNTLAVTGNTTLGSALAVGGATSINNTLGVTGNTTLASASGSTLIIPGATSINNTLGVTGDTTLASASGSILTVPGATTLGSTLYVTGNITLNGALTASSATKVNNTFEAIGNTTLASALSSVLVVGGATSINSSLTVTGASTLAAITASGATKINNSLDVTGAGTFAAITASGATRINNSLDVTGTATLAGLSATTITATGASKVSNTFETTGTTKLATASGSTLTVTGATALNSTLAVTGATTLSSDLTFSSTTSNRTVTFDTAPQSLIQFKSSASVDDKAFILFKQDSTLYGSSSTSENVRFTIGVFNDFDATNSDALDIQGGYRLKLNAGSWDSELNAAIGTPVGTSTSYGISFCVHDVEKMALTSSGLTVGTAAALSSTLAVTGASTLGSTLTVAGVTTISNTFETTGTTKLATASGSTLTVTGATTFSSTLAVTGATTLSSDLTFSASSSNRTVTFDTAPQSLIQFKSSASVDDKAFILFKQDSTLYGSSSSAENVRFTIGVFNDFNSTNSDALDIQGGYRLKLNAGSWDSELNAAIGTPVGTSTSYGISFCVHDVEKMALTSSALTVGTAAALSSTLAVTGASTLGSTLKVTGATTLGGGLTVTGGTAVAGIPAIEIQMVSKDLSGSGGTNYSCSATFSREVSSAVPVIQYIDVYYTKTTWVDVNRFSVEPGDVTISGATVTFNLLVRWQDSNADDPYAGRIKIAVIGTLKYAI